MMHFKLKSKRDKEEEEKQLIREADEKPTERTVLRVKQRNCFKTK